MTDKLTERQREVLDLIARHIRVTGVPPTRLEIARAFGFRSANAAEEHLRALARHGAIELTRGRSRGIRLLGPERERKHKQEPRPARAAAFGTDGGADPAPGPVRREAGLPVIGRVAAGSPILAIEHVEERCPVDPDLFRPRADFLLRVRGESMIGAGILDGDLLAVHAAPEAQDGRIVVARLGDEVTVKRLRRHPRQPHLVELQAANPAFPPIAVDLREQELVIEGIAVGLLRLGMAEDPLRTRSQKDLSANERE